MQDNTNGIVPSGPAWRPRPRLPAVQSGGTFGWLGRMLPGRAGDRLLGRRQQRGALGGGDTDGVFANLSAKPAVPREPQDGELELLLLIKTRRADEMLIRSRKWHLRATRRRTERCSAILPNCSSRFRSSLLGDNYPCTLFLVAWYDDTR